MRASVLPCVLLMLAACNDPYSNDDLTFLKVLPVPGDIDLGVPTDVGEGEEPVPDAEQAPLYRSARAIAERQNRLVSDVLRTFQELSKQEPTFRDENRRIWGPFTEGTTEFVLAIDRIEANMVLKTTSTSTPAEVETTFNYGVAARGVGDAEFIGLVEGRYAEVGVGTMLLNLDAIRTLSDPNLDGRGRLAVGHDTRFGQTTIEMTIDLEINLTAPFETPEGYYHFVQDPSRGTTFTFAVRCDLNTGCATPNSAVELYWTRARWNTDHRGRADVNVTEGDLGGLVAYASECWDERFVASFRTTNVANIFGPPFGDLSGCAPEHQGQSFYGP